MRPAPSLEEIRRHNLGLLLRHVHVFGATSRAELTARTGLNRSTIGALTADLAGAGLVREETPRETGRAGRPSLVVRPESARVYVLALAVSADRVTAARIGLGGVVLARREVQLPRGQFTAADAVGGLRDFVTSTSAPAGSVCVGTGAAVSGRVRRDGQIRPGQQLAWHDEPFAELLAAALGPTLASRPMAVGNDADLSALAEHTRGVAIGSDDVLYLHGDVGIGAGIIAGGRPLTGASGYAGEVGHMVVNPQGHRCVCGSAGCWETEIGEQALVLAAGRAGTGRELVREIVSSAARGDRSAETAVRQVGDWLGFGVANLVNIFNPATVVFGGTLRDVYLAAAARVRSRINEIGLPGSREQVRLRTPALESDAPLIGAAELAFARLLADPLEAAA